ncbi:MarR family winged helix-turn-helix transcriptional regulator [Chryseobacterium gallinarum]|nr:MarR family transcriptional regulator [Chryseobacterium gallinarum]
MMLLSNHLCFKAYAVSRLITGLYKPYLEKLSITYPQYLVMLVLWENGKISIGRIGEYLHLDNGTLTPLLKRMEKNGLLNRIRSTDDERVVLISLTEKGAALQHKARSIPEAVQACIDLDEDRKKQLMATLDDLLLTNSDSKI